MSKTAAIIISVFVAIFIGALIILGIQKPSDSIDYSSFDAADIIPANEYNGGIGDLLRGSKDATVFLVEYADFSCPMCGESQPTLHEYLEDKAGAVAIIFRHFPVQSIHPNSIAAASAAEAAGLIKKPAAALADEAISTQIASGMIDDTYFFEMADALFKNRNVWSSAAADVRTNLFVEFFQTIAPEASTDEFLSLLGGDAVKAKVNFDLGLGRYQGVTGTPSFFLDDARLDIKNMTDLDSVLKPAIETKLK